MSLNKKKIIITKMSIVHKIIQQAQHGEKITFLSHINTRTDRGENVLLYYLLKNIKSKNKIVIPVVQKLVDAGASLVASDDNGRTPFILLLNRMEYEDQSETILQILKKNKSNFPKEATSPYLIIYLLMSRHGPLERHAHPLRRILGFLVQHRLYKQDDWSKLVNRMEEAVRNHVYDFVVDIIHFTDEHGKSFREGLTRLLTTAIDADADPKFILFLLDRGAVVDTAHLFNVAYKGDYALFKRMIDFTDDSFDKNDFLTTYLSSVSKKIKKGNEGYDKIYKWLLDHGAHVIPETFVLEELIRENRKDIIKDLYQHGTTLYLPAFTVPKNHAYYFVKKELDRLQIVDSMGDTSKRITIRKKKRKRQTELWQEVAQESIKLPPDVAKQLRQYMN